MTSTIKQQATETLSKLHSQYGRYEYLKAKEVYDVGRSCGMTFKSIGDVFLVPQNKVGTKYNFSNFSLDHLSDVIVGARASRTSKVRIARVPRDKAETFANATPTGIKKSFELASKVSSLSTNEVYMPQVDPNFVKWGCYKSIETALASKAFFPIFISGMSGNGKSMVVEQACAEAGREYIRVQISPETDEGDLLGNFSLKTVNTLTITTSLSIKKRFLAWNTNSESAEDEEGDCEVSVTFSCEESRFARFVSDEDINASDYEIMSIQANTETVFNKGPVIVAMERGLVLLLDEIDRGSNKLLCLQSVLEGKPVLIKKTGEIVYPVVGFNVIATANSKGRGSDDGRYSGTTVIDDAFLERFSASIDQPYAPFKVEKEIVTRHLESFGVNDEEFADKLANWSSVIRTTYDQGATDDLISTRRLCHIAKAYSIFKDRAIAIDMCISRFEVATRTAFLSLYSKIDAGLEKAKDNE